jgi:alpha-tubulin suppressor-like RCC1 family protein
MYTWGNNYHCQCGIQKPTSELAPVTIENLDFSEYFPGGGHNLALTSEGMLWGWGRNDFFQLGFREEEEDKRREGVPRPQQIFSDLVRTAAAGLDHNLVLTKKGELMGWGKAVGGQLGVNKGRYALKPTKIEIPTPVAFLFCGAHCSAVGTIDGSLYVFGKDLFKLEEVEDYKNYPVLMKNFQIRIPGTQKRWEQIARWVFLGCLNGNSIFFRLPKEIVYNFVHAISFSGL